MRRLVRLVLSACVLAIDARAFALSKIYSPDPDKWLSVTSSITLDPSVSSTDSYGSSDYNHTNALDRTAFTAYLAIWSGFADRQYWWEPYYKFQINDSVLRRVYEISNGAGSISFADIMNSMRSLGDEHKSSTYFDTLYGTPNQFGFTSTVDLSKWTRMAAFCDLVMYNSSFYSEYAASLLWPSMAGYVCFGEYSASGRTLPDDLHDFWNSSNPHKLPHRFEDVVGVAFGDNETILEITNTASSVLSRKPLAATSQAMAIQDADFHDTNSEYLFYTQRVDTVHSFSGTADTDTINVEISSAGTLTILSPPSHASCGEIDGRITTNTTVTTPIGGVDCEPLRVSSCIASASLSGSSDIFVSVSDSVESDYLMRLFGLSSETNVLIVKTVQASIDGLYLNAQCTIVPTTSYADPYVATMEKCFIESAGTVFHIPTTARASSSYSISRGKEGSMDFTPSSSYQGWTYFLASYAVNTNPPTFGECINFGYDGASPKPSKDMSHAAWSYAGFGPYYHSESSYKSQMAQRLRTIHETLRGQQTLAAKSSVGDFEDAESWLCSSSASGWIEEIDTFSASYSVGTYTVTQIVECIDGVYHPESVTISASARIVVSGSRSHGTDKLHPSIGANAKVKGMTKQRIEPCAVRRQD